MLRVFIQFEASPCAEASRGGRCVFPCFTGMSACFGVLEP